MLISSTNLLCVLLTYLIESWISPGCSYEFNVVYMEREKLQYFLYYNNIWSAHFQEQKINKRKSLRDIFVYHFLFYTYSRPFDRVHDENAMNSLVIRAFDHSGSHQCSITKAVLKNFAIFTRKHLCWNLFAIKNLKSTLLK